MAQKIKDGRQDVTEETYIKNDDGKVVYNEEQLSDAWKQHFEELLNESEWDKENLTPVEMVQGLSLGTGSEMTREAIRKKS